MTIDLKFHGLGAIAVFTIATIAACMFSVMAMVGHPIFTKIAIAMVSIAGLALIVGIGFLIAAELRQNFQG